MVKNNLSNSTHSLRGSVSSLSLRQSATTNAELERARQTIKELEEANAALDKENKAALEKVKESAMSAERERVEDEKALMRAQEMAKAMEEQITSQKKSEMQKAGHKAEVMAFKNTIASTQSADLYGIQHKLVDQERAKGIANLVHPTSLPDNKLGLGKTKDSTTSAEINAFRDKWVLGNAAMGAPNMSKAKECTPSAEPTLYEQTQELARASELARQSLKELEETNAALEKESRGNSDAVDRSQYPSANYVNVFSREYKQPAQAIPQKLYKPEQMRNLPENFTQLEKTKWEAGLRSLYTHIDNNPPGSETHVNALRKLSEFSRNLEAKLKAIQGGNTNNPPVYHGPTSLGPPSGFGSKPISSNPFPNNLPPLPTIQPPRPLRPYSYDGYGLLKSAAPTPLGTQPTYTPPYYPQTSHVAPQLPPRPTPAPIYSIDAGSKRKLSNSLWGNYEQAMMATAMQERARRGIPSPAKEMVMNKLQSAEAYAQPFCEFLTENPTVWHAVDYFESKLSNAGFKKLSERKTWNDELIAGGKYFISRNGSSLIAFTVGTNYKSGNGVAMVAGHVDALTARLKPISNKKTAAGYVQLGVAPYAGALNSTWWDRDLGIGGRVLVKDEKTGKIVTKLVKLGWPIARIPTLAPHFGIGMTGQENKETQTVPIIGLDSNHASSTADEFANLTLGSIGTFVATQPPKLVRAIAGELSITDFSSIVNWELELYDTQPAQLGGLDKEFIFGGRIDDKVCSWAAMEGLLAASASPTSDDGIIKLCGVFDDEEIGSLLRQGAKGNFLPSVVERITESFAPNGTMSGANLLSQTYANSFLISADVTHAVNPNFLASYEGSHAPRLNVGLVICADAMGHMTTDSVSTALLTRVAEKSNNKLQFFYPRNDLRNGGTIGPSLSSMMGVRAIDAGIPQLSMHSIRATIGNLDPGLGVRAFAGFFEHYESVDREFE